MAGAGKKKKSKVEEYKEASGGLYGPIPEELGDPSDHFSENSIQLLKHHGTYQQDDRDVRLPRKKEGKDKLYRFMVRTKFPGGAITGDQYLVCDELAAKYGQDDLRITSRQGFQFHGVAKSGLRALIHDLNRLASITTLGGCGDVVRNTMANPVADIDPRYKDCGANLIALAKTISDHFLPKTTAYYDLWIDDEKVTVNDDGTVVFNDGRPTETPEEPIYGKAFLPRKFKIGIATDFDNAVDVYTQDIGVIAVTESGKITGYEILVGGGLGYTHHKKETYPRAGTPLAFVAEEDVVDILTAIVKVQRDHGGRTDRKQARMKYVIDAWGIDKFRETVFEYAGREFPTPKGLHPTAQPDYLGWRQQYQDGLNYVGAWVENGRIRDFPDSFQFKTGLREIIKRFDPSVRMTPHHNVVLANIKDEDVDAVQAMLDEYRIPTDKGIGTLRRMEMACPALPYCGLALSEAERAMPAFIQALEDAGHGDDDVSIRMSGCPNNCSRPASAEIGIVGQGKGQYTVSVGGEFVGTRLNNVLTEKVKFDDLAPMVSDLLNMWKHERQNGERFGDWSYRVGLEELRNRIEAQTAGAKA